MKENKNDDKNKKKKIAIVGSIVAGAAAIVGIGTAIKRRKDKKNKEAK